VLLRRIVTFAAVTLAFAAAWWAELKEHPSVGYGRQQQHDAAEKVGVGGEATIFFSDLLRSVVEWTEGHHDFVIAVGTVFLAFFTFALFAATLALVLLGKRQASDVQQLIGAAQLNANASIRQANSMYQLQEAAREQGRMMRDQALATFDVARATLRNAHIAEKALIDMEAPHLVPRIIAPGVNVKLTGYADEARKQPLWKIDFGNQQFAFWNYGRSPTQLMSFYKNLYFADDSNRNGLPDPINPDAVECRLLPAGIFVMPGGESRPYMHEGAAQVAQYNPGRQGLYFMGFVRYSDALNNCYISGFCFQFDSVNNQFVLSGGDSYNYRRREEGEPQRRDC